MIKDAVWVTSPFVCLLVGHSREGKRALSSAQVRTNVSEVGRVILDLENFNLDKEGQDALQEVGLFALFLWSPDKISSVSHSVSLEKIGSEAKRI